MHMYIYMYGVLQTQREEITEYDALENIKLQAQREEIYVYIYIRLAPNPRGGADSSLSLRLCNAFVSRRCWGKLAKLYYNFMLAPCIPLQCQRRGVKHRLERSFSGAAGGLPTKLSWGALGH